MSHTVLLLVLTLAFVCFSYDSIKPLLYVVDQAC